MRIVFQPDLLSFEKLLDIYLEWYPPYPSEGQYRSLIVPATDSQYAHVTQTTPAPTAAPKTPEAIFWDAEDYHQKYRLRRNAQLVERLEVELGRDWDRHPIATKLNAAIRGKLDPKPWLSKLSSDAQRSYRLGR